MKRSKFLKILGIGSAAAIVAPKLLIPENKPKWTNKSLIGRGVNPITGELSESNHDLIKKYPLTSKEAFPMACTGVASPVLSKEELKVQERYEKWLRTRFNK